MQGSVILFLASLGLASARFRLVPAPNGDCIEKMAYGFFRAQRSVCDTMGGAYNGDPGSDEWIGCHMDFCKIPGPMASNRAVSTSYVWGIASDQGNRATSESRTYVGLRMQRRDCDNIHGYYNQNFRIDEWMLCHLYMVRLDGSDRQNIDSLIFYGGAQGDCANKVAYTIIRMTHRKCVQIDGSYNGSPGANDWIDCHLDVCLSPVMQCEPSDAWSPVQVCRNPSSSSFTCSFQMKTGIERSSSSSSTSGGSVSATVSSEVGGELEGVFTAKMSVSVTTGFSWSSTTTNRNVWRSSTTRTFQVNLNPHQSVSISQVVGSCGNYKVDTAEYKVEDITMTERLYKLLKKLNY